jgi:branched-chain amino acid transport system substrate-binding protein
MYRKHTRAAVVAAIVSVIATLGALPATAQEPETLKFGRLLPETGALDFLGPPMVQATRMAVEDINAAGGVNDAQIELVERDDGTDPDVAAAAADDLIAEDVQFVIGAAASGVSLAVIDKFRDAGIPQCSPSNTGVQFSTYPDEGNYFRTAPPDNLQSKVLSNLIVDDGFSDVLVIARSDEYGEGFGKFLRKELKAAGATVPPVEVFDPEATSFDDIVQAIADANPEAVAMISFAEGGPIIQGAIEQGVGPADIQWYGADGIQSSSFYEDIDPTNPAVVEGLRGSAPSAAPAGGEETFRERFAAFAPDVDLIYSGHSYDCIVIAALAAAQGGSNDAATIKKNINKVTSKGTKCTLVADCLELIADGENIDYDGAAGVLDFTKKGEPGAGEYDTWEFDSAGAVQVIDESIPVSGKK